MKKLIAASILAIIASASFAQTAAPQKEYGWTQISTSSNTTYSIKDKSVTIDKNNNGEAVVVGVGRVTDKVNNRSTINKWYVTLSHCDEEVGNLVVLEVDGKFQTSIAFAFNQGSNGSTIAEALCGVYQSFKAQRMSGKSKGLSV